MFLITSIQQQSVFERRNNSETLNDINIHNINLIAGFIIHTMRSMQAWL